MSEQITEGDLNSVLYFITEYGDVTRWVHWENKKEAILQAVPSLQRAFYMQEVADDLLKQALADVAELQEGMSDDL